MTDSDYTKGCVVEDVASVQSSDNAWIGSNRIWELASTHESMAGDLLLSTPPWTPKMRPMW